MSGFSIFQQVIPNRQQEIRNSELRQNQNAVKTLFFGLHLNLGAKFRTEIESLSLTKLCKNISPPWNLLNQQKIDAYGTRLNNLLW